MTAPTTQRAIPADTLAVRLLLARRHAGDLAIRQAAEQCGLNYGSWSNWEHGVKPQDLLKVVDAIAEGLNIDYDWLLHGGPLAQPEGTRPRVLSRPQTTGRKMRTPIGRIHASVRTDSNDKSTLRTGRKVAAGRPIVAHAA